MVSLAQAIPEPEPPHGKNPKTLTFGLVLVSENPENIDFKGQFNGFWVSLFLHNSSPKASQKFSITLNKSTRF